jgi:hypothetical protein
VTDPTQGQPTEEELQAYLEQLRTADVAEVVVQAFNMLGTGANVKLGRPDARIAIDVLDAVVGAVDGRIDERIVEQMRAGVTQLKTAQVESEREQAGAAPSPGPEPAASSAAPPSGDQQAPQTPGAPPRRTPEPPGGQGQRMTDRLWVPGREPRPGA